jgi:hypothetical protein
MGCFCLRHRVQTSSGAHPASYPMGNLGFYPKGRGRGVNLTIHLHLVPRLRMQGAISLFPQYVFMAWCLIKQEMRFHGVVLSKARVQIYLYLQHASVEFRTGHISPALPSQMESNGATVLKQIKLSSGWLRGGSLLDNSYSTNQGSWWILLLVNTLVEHDNSFLFNFTKYTRDG